MKAIRISSFYKRSKIIELQKGLGNQKPFIILAKNGKRILISHGSRDGKILLEKEYIGLYDEIWCCWKDTNEINYITFREYTVNSEKSWFIIQFPMSEYVNLTEDSFLQACNNEIIEA